MKKLLRYLNPIPHLGDRHYSYLFPLIVNLSLSIVSEVYAYQIAKDPMIVETYIVFVNVALVIYFAFREGIAGGFITSAISIAYYFYIIYTRHFVKRQYISGIDTIFILAILYFFLAYIIGWLKERIDQLIDRQTDERRRLEAIIQQLPVGVLITDKNGRLQHQNKQIAQILGKKYPANYIFGKHTPLLKDMFNGEEVIPAQVPLAQALTKRAIINKQYTIERGSHKQAYLQVNASAIRNKRGEIIAAAQIVSDITQQKELERQKDDFLSMASHELKTPITSLKMFVDLQTKQLNEKDPTKAKYYNERIRDQANRLKELTNDLLDVSRIQTGKLRFNKEIFDISEVVKDTVEGLQASTKHHHIIIKSSGKHRVQADKYRIYQVLVNLITNAVKYSPKAMRIIVKVKKIKHNIVVSVQDFGIGIDQSEQHKIFEKLYQVTDPEEKTFPGLGLGLYISKQIIERHEGKIWVKSKKRKGATFFFCLPAYTG